VLTNNHVIRGATSVTVTLASNGHSYRADVVGTAPSKDVAVLKLRGASGLTTATVGDGSDVADLRKGDSVVGVGNAAGTGSLQAAKGTVTALDQSITAADPNGAHAEKLHGLIGIDAAVISGDSGGPLYDAQGKIVGMDTAGTSSPSGPAQMPTVPGRSGDRSGTTGTRAYAIPIDNARKIATGIESGVQTSSIHIGLPGFIGVEVTDAAGQGAGVSSVLAGTPAESAGITPGSVITAVGGATVSSPKSLRSALAGQRPGTSVAISWTGRGGQYQHATIRLATGPAD
jgi:S1-C subfamily serine protease